MQRNSSSELTRTALLHSAAQVIARSGVARLTLEAVAKEAGVSKGGLLYHFASKNALIQAMIAELADGMVGDLKRGANRHEGQSAPVTRAIIEQTANQESDRLVAALVAAIATEPTLLEPARDAIRERFAMLHDEGIDFELAAILNLAADGLWLMAMIGADPLSAGQRRKLFARMILMIDESGPAPANRPSTAPTP